MKEYYEKPLYVVEEFSPGQVCTSNCASSDLEMQCLQGGNTATYNVVSKLIDNTCEIDAQISYKTTAFKVGSMVGTDGTVPAKMDYDGKSQDGRAYYADTSKNNALLYFCVVNGRVDNSLWDDTSSETVLYHKSGHQDTTGMIHCEVLGVNSTSVTSG